MSRPTRRDLAQQLTGLLNDIDIAIRARRHKSATPAGGPPATARRDAGIRQALVAALRRLTHPAGNRRLPWIP
jgi:hypothetical protein